MNNIEVYNINVRNSTEVEIKPMTRDEACDKFMKTFDPLFNIKGHNTPN